MRYIAVPKKIIAMRFLSFVLLCTLLSATACKKHTTSPQQAASSLFGTWRHVCYSGGFAGFPRTNVAPGHTETIAFRSDSTFISIYDTSVHSGTFSVRLQTAYTTGRQENMLIINGTGNILINYIHDTLLLSQDVNDGMTDWYVKM